MRSSPFCTQALYTMHKDMKMNRDEQKQQHIVIQLKTIHLLFKCRQKSGTALLQTPVDKTIVKTLTPYTKTSQPKHDQATNA